MADWQAPVRNESGEFSATHFASSPELLAHPTLGWLAALLVEAAAESRLPRPDEVTPRRIGPAAMPTVLMLDLVGHPARYRIRLEGTKWARLSGRDSTGRFFDELAEHHGEVNSYYLGLMDHVAQQRAPLLLTADMYYRKQSWQRFRVLWAPLEAATGQVARIVMALDVPAPVRPVRRSY
ncbi:MAG: PAS domain-containing protein [Sneathiellaceae bacterium]